MCTKYYEIIKLILIMKFVTISVSIYIIIVITISVVIFLKYFTHLQLKFKCGTLVELVEEMNDN